MVFISLYDFLYHSISPTFFLKKILAIWNECNTTNYFYYYYYYHY